MNLQHVATYRMSSIHGRLMFVGIMIISHLQRVGYSRLVYACWHYDPWEH